MTLMSGIRSSDEFNCHPNNSSDNCRLSDFIILGGIASNYKSSDENILRSTPMSDEKWPFNNLQALIGAPPFEIPALINEKADCQRGN